MDLPDQYMVHLEGDSFKRMKNLKILIVRNGHFYGSPQHLPNNLRLLDWMEYPSSSLPSSFLPKKLVVLNLSRSRFTMQEPFKVRFHFIISFFILLKQCLRFESCLWEKKTPLRASHQDMNVIHSNLISTCIRPKIFHVFLTFFVFT